MIVSGSRLRQIGWAAVFAVCLAAFTMLTFRVNALKADVQHAERQIVRLERAKTLLETEFQTRANQQQLADWNEVEFGYRAPEAGQYLEGERQLASLGEPRLADAPSPIRVAHKAAPKGLQIIAMVSPMTGTANGDGEPKKSERGKRKLDLAERLAMVDLLPEVPDTSNIATETGE
ncbi:hypothetical protein [Altererythrobacter aquiaggeris]|uniref:hypothetical protein n=1 Tax=Aestuarierythrobacter aquiaggeris TaxID=1898396 RepID=UPI00301931E4